MKDGQKHAIKAQKDIILSGGAINSPQLLMLSGIGPKDHLKSLGVCTYSVSVLHCIYCFIFYLGSVALYGILLKICYPNDGLANYLIFSLNLYILGLTHFEVLF